MLIKSGGRAPRVHPDAWVAPDTTLCGDVELGEGCRVMHGARLIAEAGGSLRLGRHCIVLENAVIRATARHACAIGDHCLVGPGAHVVGATIEAGVFIATGAAVFHGAWLGAGCEVRIGASVHIRTTLAAGATVPIGWVAVGDPAEILPPDRHDDIWRKQAPLDFPGWVYGCDRAAPDLMRRITTSLAESIEVHRDDEVIAP